MSAAVCDCLTAEDRRLLHYVHCAVVAESSTMPSDSDDVRALAELAAYRDIDVALSVLRSVKGLRGAR